jgi:hypothetical protein
MSVLLLRYLPYIAAVLVVFGAGTYTGYHLNPWHGRYTSLQAADAVERAKGEEAVRKTLSDQLAQAQETTRNNQAAMVVLANENVQTAADRDATVARVHRLEQLLSAAQATRAAASAQLPQTGDRSSAPTASGDPGIDRAGELLIAARNECRRNASRLQALIAEITPQL